LGPSPTKQTLNSKFGTQPTKEGVGLQKHHKIRKIGERGIYYGGNEEIGDSRE
jgi:hypothetical protein